MPKIVPEDQHRQKLFGRVAPATMRFLKDLGEPNLGRAVDHAIQILLSSKPIPPPTIYPDHPMHS